MHKTHIFDQKNNAKKIFFLPTYLPYFFSGRYRKQTIFFRPYAMLCGDLQDITGLEINFLFREPNCIFESYLKVLYI